jgi:hypothetical protein
MGPGLQGVGLRHAPAPGYQAPALAKHTDGGAAAGQTTGEGRLNEVQPATMGSGGGHQPFGLLGLGAGSLGVSFKVRSRTDLKGVVMPHRRRGAQVRATTRSYAEWLQHHTPASSGCCAASLYSRTGSSTYWAANHLVHAQAHTCAHTSLCSFPRTPDPSHLGCHSSLRTTAKVTHRVGQALVVLIREPLVVVQMHWTLASRTT